MWHKDILLCQIPRIDAEREILPFSLPTVELYVLFWFYFVFFLNSNKERVSFHSRKKINVTQTLIHKRHIIKNHFYRHEVAHSYPYLYIFFLYNANESTAFKLFICIFWRIIRFAFLYFMYNNIFMIGTSLHLCLICVRFLFNHFYDRKVNNLQSIVENYISSH